MTHPHLRPYDSVLGTIGWTPLIRLARVSAGIRTPVYGKAEYANPGASVKDRIGLAIIEDAERRGELKPGGTIVEGTSGNTGVGLAIAAAIKGYRCIFTMPDKMSQEKVRLLKAYGAEVVITPTAVPPDHPDNYVMKAKQIVRETPNAILANQFYNAVNPEAHYATMGPEIWEQTEGKVTHFVAGAGTGGTVSGAGKYLKEQNPAVRVIAGDPIGSLYTHYHRTGTLGEGHPYKVEGIGGDKIPTTVWFDCIDEFRQVPDRTSLTMARRLAREEGILVGGSAGLNVWLALEVARELDSPGALVVTVLCDTGERYLSKLFNDEWMQENQMLEAPRITAEQLLQRRPSAAPALVSVAPRGGGPPGAQPHEHVGSEPDSGAGRRAVGRRAHRRHPHDPGSHPACPAGPAGARGHGAALPGGGRQYPERPGRGHADTGESGGAGAEGWEAHRHREPVRRAAAAHRNQVRGPTAPWHRLATLHPSRLPCASPF